MASPGLRFLVESDYPNHLAETWNYDTFGRLVGRTALSGQTTALTYSDTEEPGVVGGTDVSIVPDGTATATRRIHLDSMGRLVMKTAPVDASRTMTIWNQYNDRGLIGAKAIYTGTPSQNLTTQQNIYINTYGIDLNWPMSECHAAADGTPNLCKTWVYDGLQTTITDESSHSTVRTNDGQGRLVTQTAPGVSDTTFGYGPFSQLESESMADGSGQTTIAYDVLGRRTSTTRKNTGTRVTTYNAFGDVVGGYKQMADGTQADSMTFGRDPSGA